MSDAYDGPLPPGWAAPTLREIARVNPALDRCIVGDDTDVTFVPMRAVEPGGGGLTAPEARRHGDVKRGYTAFLSGDVIAAKITPCMENGKVAVVPDVPDGVAFGSTEFHVVRPERGVQARWIAQFLLQQGTRRAAQRAMTGAVGQMRVPASFLDSVRIPLAPEAEQSRISDVVEELLSDVEAGVASLEQARAKLKAYRASVLKSAVDGTLTAEWRATHPNAEPAADLLERVLAERRRRWEEAQLARYLVKGQRPPSGWKSKYRSPVTPNVDGRSSPPDGWCVATIDQLAEVGTGATPNRGMRARYYSGGTIPWLTSSCVNEPSVHAPSEYVTDTALAECNLTVYPAGTLLIAMYGEGRTRGKTTELAIESSTNQALAALITSGDVRAFLKLFLAKNYDETRRAASGGVQPNLNLSVVREIELPLPPLAEQDAIVEIVEDQLSVVDHLEADLDAKLRAAQSLRQSILRHAFTGRLVPQDPNDEPASALLARIAAERAARDTAPGSAKAQPRRGRRRATTPSTT